MKLVRRHLPQPEDRVSQQLARSSAPSAEPVSARQELHSGLTAHARAACAAPTAHHQAPPVDPPCPTPVLAPRVDTREAHPVQVDIQPASRADTLLPAAVELPQQPAQTQPPARLE